MISILIERRAVQGWDRHSEDLRSRLFWCPILQPDHAEGSAHCSESTQEVMSVERTIRIRTARSRRRSSQNAQLASHLLPSRKAVGMTVFVTISRKIGHSSPCSTTLAKAMAS